jgi:hypothetical protein
MEPQGMGGIPKTGPADHAPLSLVLHGHHSHGPADPRSSLRIRLSHVNLLLVDRIGIFGDAKVRIPTVKGWRKTTCIKMMLL